MRPCPAGRLESARRRRPLHVEGSRRQTTTEPAGTPRSTPARHTAQACCRAWQEPLYVHRIALIASPNQRPDHWPIETVPALASPGIAAQFWQAADEFASPTRPTAADLLLKLHSSLR